ncbi:hypothetical protein ACS0TY_036230 [Phlomoides rotata]
MGYQVVKRWKHFIYSERTLRITVRGNQRVAFLQDFLEGYSHEAGYRREADYLEKRIADTAEAAEDIIESDIVNEIFFGMWRNNLSVDLYQGLQEVMLDMDSLRIEVMEIKEKMGVQDQLHKDSSVSAGLLRSPMVSFDEVLDKVMDKLIGQRSNLEIVPIVGMGGMGKTTLARNIYENRLIVHHFDILAWATVSQVYSVREIPLELVCYLEREKGKEILIRLDEFELGEKLYKLLSGWRYFIVMDNIWSTDVWNKVRFLFPDNNNGSKIMITTRLSNLAFELCGSQSHGFQMNFLNEDKSWDLLCKIVFGEESCPIELEEIGKKIARNCKGLPLSIVDDELCLQILYMSYKQLPTHLKPCFLYMGVLSEDRTIRVSELIKLWVAEGFLKPIGGKSLEEAAQEYFKELIDRNLVIAHKWGSSGKIKLCKVHDLLRDLCLREADKQKFVCLLMQQHLSPQSRFNGRCIAIHQCMSPEKYHSRASHAPEYGPLARSLVWDFNAFQYALLNCSVKWHSDGDMFKIILRSGKLRLLRIFKLDDRFPVDDLRHEYNKHFKDVIIRLLNSRYLSYPDIGPSLPSLISRLWNLQTLIARDTSATAPPEIWKMSLLKHVEFCNIYLPDPPIGETGDDFVLGNLQTLFRIRIWDCRVKVVEKIPNIKTCQGQGEAERLSLDFLNNLSNLHKLESLCCFFIEGGIRRALLQNLRNSFIGPHWETVEGDFCSLKFLLIRRCPDLEYWDTESTHFPCLEHLRLDSLMNLEKIPQDIGDIPTLQSIELVNCGVSAVISAKWILEEQEELGNEALHVRVVASKDDQVLESLRSHNFQVETR